ncbi:MAG: hypothetical protein DRO09_03305 [Thermoprotei archaeon]|nr:MAG: hypothetical protein DRO09_03305 [Thermoprotei archaeon]
MKLEIIKNHVIRHVGGKFLRQFASPERIPQPIDSNEKLLKWVGFFKKDCYVSVFYFERWDKKGPDPKSVIINTIYFDFDCETKPERAYAETRTLLEILERSKIIPRVYFSGAKGFAIYLDVPDLRLNYPKDVLKTFCMRIMKELDLKTADIKVFGDIMRVSRLPGTVNSKSIRLHGEALYCTPLGPNELLHGGLTIDDIFDIAKKGNPDFEIKRNESLKLAKILKELDLKITARKAVEKLRRLKAKLVKVKSQGIRPCIKKLIELIQNGVKLDHKLKVAVVAELYHVGWDIQQIEEIFKNMPNYRPEKTRYQILHITKTGSNAPYKPFKCQTLYELGACDLVGNSCPRRVKIVKR